jgi:hypothetical protein
VLAGVDEHLAGDLAQRAGDGGGLDELRPVADHREHAHVIDHFVRVSND